VSIDLKQQKNGNIYFSARKVLIDRTIHEKNCQMFDDVKASKQEQIDLSVATDNNSVRVKLLFQLNLEVIALKRKLISGGHCLAIVDVFELLKLGAYFGGPIAILTDWNSL